MESTPAPSFCVSSGVEKEWLITNGRGGFASGTVIGVPTRRYHGLLVASARPPLERWMLWSGVLDRVGVDGRHWEVPAFDFGEVFHPQGFEWQCDFAFSNKPPSPWVRFGYRFGNARLTRCICLPHGGQEAVVVYRLEADPRAMLSLEVCPFAAMRDFHGLTHAFGEGFPVEPLQGGVVVGTWKGGPRLALHASAGDGTSPPSFELRTDWWYGFFYRQEAHRGMDCREDLFTPGWFRCSGTGRLELTIHAAADFGQVEAGGRSTIQVPGEVFCSDASSARPSVEQRLVEAVEAFVVKRLRADGRESATILAGYPWFGDWGRDAFIALPGLLLETGRFEEARQVLETFASAQRDGLIPNRFSDYGDGCDYNSVDASLWYIHAADCYVRAAKDESFWRDVLEPVCARVVDAFVGGTLFDIKMDDDGLIRCGNPATQITWMDAKFGETVFTPRHGKPVEINALWYHALCLLAERARSSSSSTADRYDALAAWVKCSFGVVFWNEALGCLYDVVRDGQCDASVRPNQIFAVSLPHSPLDRVRQRRVVARVESDLWTPYGLRSLSPRDPAYRGRYEGGPYERDRAYHQGTVWAWLMGAYVEAYLRVHDFSSSARQAMRRALGSLVAHLDEAGLGSVSEVFDGDPPHRPGGCIAQAWSVAELLRAWRLTSDPRDKRQRSPARIVGGTA